MSPKPIEFEEPRKQLIGQLKILIAWRSGYSEKHIGLCAEVQPVQHEVARILEAWPGLSSEPAITEAIETARQLLIQKMPPWDVPPQERVRVYTLHELMRAPLTAFAPAGATWSREPDWGEWKPYEDEGDFVGLKETGIGTARLGQLADAWYLSDGGGEPREIIEHWCVDFYQPEEHETNRLRESECFYRYSVARPDLGRVYTWIEDALRGEGGVSLGEAMLDGQAHGLLLPDEEPRHAQ